jgi:hypothetical protein
MALAEDFRKDLREARQSLGLANAPNPAPVEQAPTDHFDRQVLNTTMVQLLLAWVTRLTEVVDELCAATDIGEPEGYEPPA